MHSKIFIPRDLMEEYLDKHMTYQQIADMEGCAKVTVYQSIDAARKKLAAFF